MRRIECCIAPTNQGGGIYYTGPPLISRASWPHVVRSVPEGEGPFTTWREPPPVPARAYRATR